MEISNLSDAEVKTLVIMMLKELSEDLNDKKKIQAEMKDTLIEIKKNLQGTSCEGTEVRIRISNLQLKEEINIQSEQQEETRIKKQKKTRRV